MKYLIVKNVLLWDGMDCENKLSTILVEDGIVKKISGNFEDDFSGFKDMETIEGDEKVMLPGLVDVHVHLREPGFEDKETIYTGSSAAVAGGYTTIVCMPNTKPVIDSIEVIQYIKEKAARALCHISMMGSITKNLDGKVLNDYAELKAEGIVGITDDGKTVMDANIMYEALKKAKENNLTVSVHCEDANLVKDNTVNKGVVSDKLGVVGRENISEDLIIQRDLMMAEEIGAKIHIQHISTKGGVDLVRRAKARGVSVTCEATPHHFVLTDESVLEIGNNAKMSPPLRSAEDVKAVLGGLVDGTIDMISTDHAPHTEKDKSGSILECANGIVGLETAFALAYTYLVKTKILSLKTLMEKMATNPSKLLNLNVGTIEVGKSFDAILVDFEQSWQVDSELFHSKGKNTPFNGFQLNGKILKTIVDGKIVFE